MLYPISFWSQIIKKNPFNRLLTCRGFASVMTKKLITNGMVMRAVFVSWCAGATVGILRVSQNTDDTLLRSFQMNNIIAYTNDRLYKSDLIDHLFWRFIQTFTHNAKIMQIYNSNFPAHNVFRPSKLYILKA